MNLIPEILITLAEDGKSFIFADNTREDNQSVSSYYWNGVTTRYNTNISLSTADVSFKPDQIYQVDLFIVDPDENEYSFLNTTVPVSSRELIITNSDLDQSDAITDGVYTFKYYLLNQFTSNAYNGTASQSTITFDTALPPSLEVGMFIKIGTIYHFITDLNATTRVVTLDTPLENTITAETTLTVGYPFTHYEVFSYNAECCIDNAVVAATTVDCCTNCTSKEMKSAINTFMLLQAARIQAKKKLPLQAQDTMDLIASICASTTYDCGCK